jgi:hypothetical protein
MAREVLASFARVHAIEMIVSPNHCPESNLSLTPGFFHDLPSFPLETAPAFMLPLGPYSHLEDYLNQLPPHLQQALYRHWHQRFDVEIVRTRQPAPWVEQIYTLYQQRRQGAPLLLQELKPEFFRDICETIPDSSFVLLFKESRLIGSSLQFRQGDMLLEQLHCALTSPDLSFCPSILGWLESIQYCLESGVTTFMRSGQMDTHTHLGSHQSWFGDTLIPGGIRLMHRNPRIHRLLSKCLEAAKTTRQPSSTTGRPAHNTLKTLLLRRRAPHSALHKRETDRSADTMIVSQD